MRIVDLICFTTVAIFLCASHNIRLEISSIPNKIYFKITKQEGYKVGDVPQQTHCPQPPLHLSAPVTRGRGRRLIKSGVHSLFMKHLLVPRHFMISIISRDLIPEQLSRTDIISPIL